MSQWAPGAQSSPVKVYPAEVTGSKWGLQDVNTVNWAQAARAAAAMCYNRGFAGGHFDGNQGPFGILCSAGDTLWKDATLADISQSGWPFTDINVVTGARAGRAAQAICDNLSKDMSVANSMVRCSTANLGCSAIAPARSISTQ